MVIDVFSKYGWIEMLRDKRSETDAQALTKIFKVPLGPYFCIFENRLWLFKSPRQISTHYDDWKSIFSDGFCRGFTATITSPCSESWLVN